MSNNIITIKYVDGETIAFGLGGEIWYLRTGPGIPCLYNGDLHKQTVPNLDNWFQSKTGHRYSYRSICDMAAAFACADQSTYHARDVVRLCSLACHEAVAEIFKTKFANDYRRAFWIEFLDPTKLPEQAKSIRDNFDNLRAKLGDDQLYNYLCRLWKACHLQNPNEASVFERLINRMGRQAADPNYPDTSQLDSELAKNVISKLLHHDLPQYPNIPEDIIRNANDIQAGRL